MDYNKTIHFRGNDGAKLVLQRTDESNPEEQKDMLTVIIDNNVISVADFPHVLISNENKSDFWDLVREEILSIAIGKRDKLMRCSLLHKLQTQLKQ